MYAVIFTRRLSDNVENYDSVAEEILALAEQQSGFIAFNSAAGAELGISISYWSDLPSIAKWKADSQHLHAQRLGKSQFYKDYSVQVCCVEKSYCHNEPHYHPNPKGAVA